MSVRIVCEHCSGELQVPQVSAGKKIRCPLCGNIFVSAPLGVRSTPPSSRLESSPWTPIREEDLDNPIPWYILLGAVAPAGMLAFVAHEPIAFAVAAVLVMIALFVATRRDWSRWSRFMGVVSLALLGYGAAAAVNLYAQGSFAQLGLRIGASEQDRSISEVEQAAWSEFSPPDSGVKLLFPGTPVKALNPLHPSGMDIFIHEAKFPRAGVTFAIRSFKIAAPIPNEKTELANLDKMLEIAHWTFFDGDPEPPRKIYYFEHPGFECLFVVSVGKKSAVLCQAFLVRDRAYVMSVSADKLEPIRPLAEKFFTSFRLLQPAEPMQTVPRFSEPDWKGMGRPPIPKVKPLASYRGHFLPPVIVLAFSLDGKRMVTGSSREHVVHWDIETGHGGRIGNTEAYPFFAVHPAGKEMVMAFRIRDEPFKIRFLPMDVAGPELGPANTDYIGFSADQKTAFVAIGQQLTAWDANETKLWHRTSNHPLTRIALSRDGRFLASAAAKEPNITLWNVEKKDRGDDLKNWVAHSAVKSDAPIQQLAFAPDGKTLASAGLDATVKIWDLANVNDPKLLAELIHIGEQFGIAVAAVEFSNDGKLLASGDFTGVIRIWDTSQWKLLHEFRACEMYEPVQTLRFSPDDAKLAAAVDMGIGRAGVHLFDMKTLPHADDGPSIGLQQTDEPPVLPQFKGK